MQQAVPKVKIKLVLGEKKPFKLSNGTAKQHYEPANTVGQIQ